jgi:hypothetical protein
MPAFPAYSRVSWGIWPNAGLSGWRRSADRARLHANSLLSGNLTGNFDVSGHFVTIFSTETAALQRLLAQFPTAINREFYSNNREFKSVNRD